MQRVDKKRQEIKFAVTSRFRPTTRKITTPGDAVGKYLHTHKNQAAVLPLSVRHMCFLGRSSMLQDAATTRMLRGDKCCCTVVVRH